MLGDQNVEEILNVVDADKAKFWDVLFSFSGNQGEKVEREKHREESYGAK